MPTPYIPVFIFAAFVAAFPIAALLFIRRTRGETRVIKDAEIRPVAPSAEENRNSYSQQLLVAAALFVIFDAAAIFLFLWAVKLNQLGPLGLFAILVFLGIPMAGYAWMYQQGLFDSNSKIPYEASNGSSRKRWQAP